MEAHERVKFVLDSYKTMPHVGLQMFAPILTNSSEEFKRINDILLKIENINCHFAAGNLYNG